MMHLAAEAAAVGAVVDLALVARARSLVEQHTRGQHRVCCSTREARAIAAPGACRGRRSLP
eukprot:3085789-Rhodomonas_salina.1